MAPLFHRAAITNETQLFDHFLIMCEFVCFHLHYLHFYCIMHMCECHMY